MPIELSRADARRVLWGSIGAGTATAGAAVGAAASLEYPLARHVNLGTLYVFGGIVTVSVICLAVRISRDGNAARLSSRLPRPIVLAYGFFLMTFLVAALAVLAACLAAAMFGAGWETPLLQALLLILLVFVAGKICADCLVNLIFLFRPPKGDSPAP